MEVERLDFGLETEEALLIFLGRGLGCTPKAQVQVGPCSEVTHVDLWLAEIKLRLSRDQVLKSRLSRDQVLLFSANALVRLFGDRRTRFPTRCLMRPLPIKKNSLYVLGLHCHGLIHHSDLRARLHRTARLLYSTLHRAVAAFAGRLAAE